jgi:LDH2 family malate/lactate/ureidoglycolate dehydrogenase
MNEPLIYERELLKEFCVNILVKTGLKIKDADIIAETLICADLRGVKSHGIVRLPTYVEKIEKGIVSLSEDMVFEKNNGATALLDAKNGLGQLAGYKAMHSAIDIARLYGIGMVGVKNSNHFGIASYYSLLALKEDMIGIVTTNSSPAIAPYGTTTPLLGTNPLAVAIPSKEKPIVLDMSMSTVARGRIRYAALTDQEIPVGWGLDITGNPTKDPNEALKGSLVPIGGVKGSGLALVIDLLCGVLTSTCLTGEVKNITDMSGPSKTGHVFWAVNISSFIDPELFKNNISTVINNIKSMDKAGPNEIFMPGEIEYNLEMIRSEEGIPLEQDVIKTLNNLAKKYNSSTL